MSSALATSEVVGGTGVPGCFKCAIGACTREFADRGELLFHVEKLHFCGASPEKIAQCTRCKNTYLYKSSGATKSEWDDEDEHPCVTSGEPLGKEAAPNPDDDREQANRVYNFAKGFIGTSTWSGSADKSLEDRVAEAEKKAKAAFTRVQRAEADENTAKTAVEEAELSNFMNPQETTQTLEELAQANRNLATAQEATHKAKDELAKANAAVAAARKALSDAKEPYSAPGASPAPGDKGQPSKPADKPSKAPAHAPQAPKAGDKRGRDQLTSGSADAGNGAQGAGGAAGGAPAADPLQQDIARARKRVAHASVAKDNAMKTLSERLEAYGRAKGEAGELEQEAAKSKAARAAVVEKRRTKCDMAAVEFKDALVEAMLAKKKWELYKDDIEGQSEAYVKAMLARAADAKTALEDAAAVRNNKGKAHNDAKAALDEAQQEGPDPAAVKAEKAAADAKRKREAYESAKGVLLEAVDALRKAERELQQLVERSEQKGIKKQKL